MTVGGPNPRVLVCDPIAEDGVAALRQVAEVDVRLGLRPEELRAVVDGYDALVVRSETKVTAEVIEAARRLQVIGRAGVGVDNIDLQAATKRGVVVVNAPTGNTVSTAEHTLALLLAVARYIPQADASVRAGRWERRHYIGTELRDKVLGILGLGQVGSEVARRARAFEMHVIAHDPFVPEDRARTLGVELVPFEQLLRTSDFVSLHLTLTDATRGLIGPRELALMKPSGYLLNVARGSIVDEAALDRALREGRLAGAALDVFQEEPPEGSPLLTNERVVLSPHLGASTTEAQERVATDIAEQVVAVLRGQPARYAVNAPLIPPETMSQLAPYMDVATKLGSLATQLAEGQLEGVEICYEGEIAELDHTPLRAAVIRGLLAPISEELVNLVNANLVAESRGLKITERVGGTDGTYANLVTVRLTTREGVTAVSGTYAHGGAHITSINDVTIDVPPAEGYLLVCDNRDRPGMIGKVGTLLGALDINISFMNVGRRERRGRALMVLVLDEPLDAAQLQQLRQIPDIFSVRLARI